MTSDLADALPRHGYPANVYLLPFFSMFTIHHGGPQQVELITACYEDNDQLYVALEQDDELYADLSVCLPGITLRSDEFIFKTYGENEGLLKAMFYTGKIEIVRTIDHTLGTLPICRLCD